MDPTQAMATLEDLIAKVEALPVDFAAHDVAKIGDDIAAIISDDVKLYRFALAFFNPSAPKMSRLPDGAKPIDRLKEALAEAKANPTAFPWQTLIPALLALIQSLLPFLHPTAA